MKRTMPTSKIHGAAIADKELHDDGRITLDEDLSRAADMHAGERAQALKVNSGSRPVTRIIAAPPGPGTVVLIGPAARPGEVGDPVVVLSCGQHDVGEARRLEPTIVRVDETNRLLRGHAGSAATERRP